MNELALMLTWSSTCKSVNGTRFKPSIKHVDFSKHIQHLYVVCRVKQNTYFEFSKIEMLHVLMKPIVQGQMAKIILPANENTG